MRLAAVTLATALGLGASILPPVEAPTPAESAASANEPEFSGHYDQPISAGETPTPPPPATGIGDADGGCLTGTYPDCQEPTAVPPVVVSRPVAARPLPETL